MAFDDRTTVDSHVRALVAVIAGCLALVAMVFYAYYENQRLDLQQPVVESCVKHRVNQKVVVQDR
jgi:hypothetical protein